MSRPTPRPRTDLVQTLGPLALASRLKRLAERLQRDVSRYYKSRKLDFEARWFPVLYALKDRNSMSVTDLARALGLTHPAINQIAGDMSRHGLIESLHDSRDERRRLLHLTPKAQRLLQVIGPIWDDIRTANADLIAETGHDLLAAIDRVEHRLNEMDMYRRLEILQVQKGSADSRRAVASRTRSSRRTSNRKLPKKP